MDLHVSISGPRFLPFLKENLGRHDDLHGLTVRGFCAMQDLYCCLLLCTYLLSSSLDLLQDMVTLTLFDITAKLKDVLNALFRCATTPPPKPPIELTTEDIMNVLFPM